MKKIPNFKEENIGIKEPYNRYMVGMKMNECMVCKNYVWELLKDKGAIIFTCTKGLDGHSQEACKEYDEREDSEEILELLDEIAYSSLKMYGKVCLTKRLLSNLTQNKEED